MLMQFNKRLRDRAVVTAAILSLFGYDAASTAIAAPVGGSNQNDNKTTSPIKHVVVLMGENRTFDHIFATFQPREGERVDNLLSKGIINIDGTPGPNYAKAKQFSASDTTVYSNSPGGKTPYTSATLQSPGTSYAPPTCYSNFGSSRKKVGEGQGNMSK
jgi:phospholipase C